MTFEPYVAARTDRDITIALAPNAARTAIYPERASGERWAVIVRIRDRHGVERWRAVDKLCATQTAARARVTRILNGNYSWGRNLPHEILGASTLHIPARP